MFTCVSASEKDIDIAVAAARNAFNTTWGKNVTGFERSRLLNKLADLIERDQQERETSYGITRTDFNIYAAAVAEIETLNNGKPVKVARYRVFTVAELLILNPLIGISTLAIPSNA